MIAYLVCAAFALMLVPAAAAVPYDFEVDVISGDLEVPWEIAFLPDGRIFVTERTGALRVIEDGVLQEEPVFARDVSGTEGGMLGMALDPDFDENSHVYLYYSYYDGDAIVNRVARYTESGNMLYDETILLDGIQSALWHAGGRIKFGPDGMLYISTGDATAARLSQDPGSLAGKILRIMPDGGIPEDNPFGDSAVYSIGHRNPQGFDWDPRTGALVAAEHGPSGERGRAHDEINLILPGANYGWPDAVGDESAPGLESPLYHTGDETWAPSGAAFYDSEVIPGLYSKYLVATLRGEHLRMLDIDNGTITQNVPVLEGFGRLRSVSVGPDGYIYVLTSNTDGRGTPAPDDDRIIRLRPPVQEMDAGSDTMQDQVRAGTDADAPSGDTDLDAGLWRGWLGSGTEWPYSGTEEEMPSCREGTELFFRVADITPVCLRSESGGYLADLGWACTLKDIRHGACGS